MLRLRINQTSPIFLIPFFLFFLLIFGPRAHAGFPEEVSAGISSPNPSELLWSKNVDDPLLKKINEGISSYYNFDFAKANTIFDEIIREYPHDPLGYYMKLENTWWMVINQIDNEALIHDFETMIDKTIDISKDRLKENPKDSGALFFLGVTYGRWGMLEGIRGKKWSSLKKSIKGREYLLDVRKVNESIYDANTPLGIYDFYTATQSQFIRLMGAFFFRLYGNKKNGLEKLSISMEKGTYTKDEAKFYTALFFLQYEKRYEEGLKLLQELHAQYPNNLTFMGMLAFAHQRLNHDNEAVELYETILKEAKERNVYGKESMATAHYFAGETLRKAGQLDRAAEHFRVVLETPLTKSFWLGAYANLELGRIYDLKGERAEAVKYYKKVLDIENYRNSQKYAKQYLKTPFLKNER